MLVKGATGRVMYEYGIWYIDIVPEHLITELAIHFATIFVHCIVAFWVFVCVKFMLPDEYIVNGDMWVQACNECIVASHPEWQGCSLNGRGAVMHDEMSIKAGAHCLTGVALLSVARWHC